MLGALEDGEAKPAVLGFSACLARRMLLWVFRHVLL